MKSVGARFNDVNYVKVDIDFDTGDCFVTMVIAPEGTPVEVTGEVTWKNGGE